MSRSQVLENPQTTIGAQDLLSIGNCTKSGFLRRQGLLERVFRFLRWRQRFVILSRGCIYIFKNEFSPRPQFSDSLRTYIRCMRGREGRMRWTFQLIPLDENSGNFVWFACLSDLERKEWMKSIKEEMMKAHKLTETTDGEDKNDYVYLEKPLPGPKERKAPPEVPDDDDDPGGEKDYTTIDDSLISERPPMPIPINGVKPYNDKPRTLPAESTTSPAGKAGKKSRKPAPEPKPEKAMTLPTSLESIRRTAFEYKGSDREEIENILIQRPEGTFLVRKSRQDKKEVLSVNIDGTLKEFKIYDKDSKFTIDHAEYFDSVEALLQNYIDHPLPKKTVNLYRAYSVIDPRYINR